MGRALIVIAAEKDRATAAEWLAKAPLRTRLEFRGPKRSLPQNDKLWACLTDIARQHEHAGRKYSTEVWKKLFMDQCGRELEQLDYQPDFVPSLDNTTLVSMGHESSKLSVAQMSDLIEFMFKWGAENGIVWSDPEIESYARMRRE